MLYKAVPTPNKHLEIDSTGYERIATHFETTSCLECPMQPDQHPVQTFVYPLFLGTIYKMFGHDYAYVVFFQYLLAVLCGLLVYLTAATLFNPMVGCIATLLWSMNLGFLVYVQLLLTEILLVAFLLGFLYFFSLWWQTRNNTYIALAGLSLGYSVIVKPAALLFIIPLSFFILLFMRGTWQKKISSVLLLLLFFYLPIMGYMTRNYLCYGHFRIAPMMSEIIYLYFAARVESELVNKSRDEIVKEKLISQQDSFDEHRWNGAHEFLMNTLYNNPFLLVRIWVINVIKTFLGLFSTQLKVLLEPAVMGGDCSFFKTSGSLVSRADAYITCGTESKPLRTIAYAEALWTIIRYLLILIACLYLVTHQQYAEFIFFIMYMGYFTAITGHDGCARYRMMIEPLLIILTAAGISSIITKKLLIMKR